MRKIISGLLLAVFMLCAVSPVRVSASDSLPDLLLSNGILRLQVGEKQNLTETMTYYKTDKEIYPVGSRIWSSSKPEVASVDQNGTVTAHKYGAAKITLRYTDNHANMIDQTIRVRVSEGGSVQYLDYVVTINEDEEINLRELLFPGMQDSWESFSWAVDKSYTASVKADGMLTGKAYGECKVTGSYTDAAGTTQTKEVKVKVIAKHWKVLKNVTITIDAGETVDLAKVFYPYAHQVSKSLTCYSADSATVSAESGGVITAVKAGETDITLKYSFSGDEYSQLIRVTVY